MAPVIGGRTPPVSLLGMLNRGVDLRTMLVLGQKIKT